MGLLVSAALFASAQNCSGFALTLASYQTCRVRRTFVSHLRRVGLFADVEIVRAPFFQLKKED